MQGMDFIFPLAIFIISVVIHEVSHGVVANMLGDPTARLAGRLTLNPVSHFDFLGSFLAPLVLWVLSAGQVVFGWAKPVPFNPYNLRAGKWGPAIVAVAGPAANILIALFFGLVIRVLFAWGLLTQQYLDIAGGVVVVNVLLAVFNLVPIPPLDGSKVLFALLPYSRRDIQTFLEANQFVFLIIFVVFLWRFLAPLVDFLVGVIVGI